MDLRVLLLIILSAFLLVTQTAQAQSKSKTPPKASGVNKQTQAVESPPPPPMEELKDYERITFDTTAATDDAFTAGIRMLMEMMQFKENLVKTVSGALDQNTTQWPADFKAIFKDKFLQELTMGPGMRWMENLFIKSYRSNFTQDEITALVQFYQTDAGKKFIEKSPVLTLRIMQDSQKIGEYIGYKVGKELANDKSKK